MRSGYFIPLAVLFFIGAVVAGSASAEEKHAQLGVYLQELDDDLRAEYDYEGHGVLIEGIVDGSGAEKAGLEKGDIIVAFNGEIIETTHDLMEAISDTEPGQKVKVVVFSDGDTRKVKVVMGAKEETLGYHYFSETSPEKFMFVYGQDAPYMGVALQDMPPQLAEYFDVDHGVLISMVEEDSPAGEEGLKAGDVIIRFDGESVKSSADLYEILYASEPGDDIEIVIVRRGDKKEVVLTLGKKKIDSSWGKGFFLNKEFNLPYAYAFPSKPDVYMLPHGEIMPGFPKKHELPEVPWLKYKFDLDDDEMFEDLEDFKEEMEELREELMDLRDEIKSLKKEI